MLGTVGVFGVSLTSFVQNSESIRGININFKDEPKDFEVSWTASILKYKKLSSSEWLSGHSKYYLVLCYVFVDLNLVNNWCVNDLNVVSFKSNKVYFFGLYE